MLLELGFLGVPSKGEGCRDRSSGVLCVVWMGLATFLKVMLHLMSSPAKTVWSFQCIKTRMLLELSGDMM